LGADQGDWHNLADCAITPIDAVADQNGGNMDFIEQIFGLSPDGGSGVFELVLFLIPIFAGLIFWRVKATGGRLMRPHKD
jgi:hypothetical protein